MASFDICLAHAFVQVPTGNSQCFWLCLSGCWTVYIQYYNSNNFHVMAEAPEDSFCVASRKQLNLCFYILLHLFILN